MPDVRYVRAPACDRAGIDTVDTEQYLSLLTTEVQGSRPPVICDRNRGREICFFPSYNWAQHIFVSAGIRTQTSFESKQKAEEIAPTSRKKRFPTCGTQNKYGRWIHSCSYIFPSAKVLLKKKEKKIFPTHEILYIWTWIVNVLKLMGTNWREKDETKAKTVSRTVL